MPTWTLAAKDLRLLVRDPRAAVILLVMPLVFILVLGLSLGEGFGQPADEKLRVAVVNLDAGLPPDPGPFPGRPWSDVVLADLAETAGIRVEVIATLDEAKSLVARGQRPAVLVFEPDFSERIHRCSFLAERLTTEKPINPFFRDGVNLEEVGMSVLRDPKQVVGASITDQLAQGTLLRVVLPWMIGRAFDRVGDPVFMDAMAVELPAMNLAFRFVSKAQLGAAVKLTISKLFDRYDLTAKTWAKLTQEAGKELAPARPGDVVKYESRDGSGVLKRGALRYQTLVPSYTVMFAFFLVLTCGWLFVAERREGTLTRLRAAPLARWQIILGKLLPCLLMAMFQGLFLMIAGWVVFGMSWGAQPLWVLPVVAATAFAAMGLALLVAAVARTETQVAIYGTLIVLVLAGVSGTLMPAELMPEQMQLARLLTPHAWALDAYKELLIVPSPSFAMVAEACGVLVLFGGGFLAVAYWLIQLD